MRILKSHPLLKLANSYLIDSPQPSNLSYLWNFGSLLAFCLIIQIITGITLAIHYNPSISETFNSVEHIMRDVNNGWMIRYLQSNTASAFLFIVYLYIHRVLNRVSTPLEWVLTNRSKPHVFISLPLHIKFLTRPVIAKSMLFTAFNMFISNKYIMSIINLVKHVCCFLVVLVSICITLVSHISFISFFWEVNKSTCLLYLITSLIMVSSAFIIWSILTKKSMPNTSTIKDKVYNNYKNIFVIAYVLLILSIPKATMYSLIKVDIQDELYILYILSLVLLFSPIQFWFTSFSLALYRENGLEKSISIASVSIRQMDYWYFFILILVTSCIVLLKINCIEYILLLYFIPTLDSTLPSISSDSTCKRTFTMDSPLEQSEICKKLRRTPSYTAWINQDNGGGSDRGHERDSSPSTRRSSSTWEEDAPEKAFDILTRLDIANTNIRVLWMEYINNYFIEDNPNPSTLTKARELELIEQIRELNKNQLEVMQHLGQILDPFNVQDRSNILSRWYDRPRPDYTKLSLWQLRKEYTVVGAYIRLPDIEIEQAENLYEKVDLINRTKVWARRLELLIDILEEKVKKET